WAVQGAREWAEHGLGTCAAVEQHTRDYRTEQDVLGEFLDEACDFNPERFTEKAELYRVYQAWAKLNGERFPMKHKRFTLRLRDRNDARVREDRLSGSRAHVWRGIALKEPLPFRVGE
ncbi:unnamed protein product, partial [marine sediment metagenome]